tara:strand:+ start:391 stop:765 length:375 start_codon:yes stop_codon:yes gene_type:complete
MKSAEFYKKKVQPYAIDDTINYEDLGWFSKFLVWIDARKYKEKSKSTETGSVAMKIDWQLAPEGADWYVDACGCDVKSGFYWRQGVKMFRVADIDGNKKDDGYIFRADDYNKNLVHCYSKPEAN